MQVPEDCRIPAYRCFGGDIRYAFLTFLSKSFLPASILYNLTPARAFGKSVGEKRSNRTKTELAEAVENCDVFKCESLTTVNNGMLPITTWMVSVRPKHLIERCLFSLR